MIAVWGTFVEAQAGLGGEPLGDDAPRGRERLIVGEATDESLHGGHERLRQRLGHREKVAFLVRHWPRRGAPRAGAGTYGSSIMTSPSPCVGWWRIARSVNGRANDAEGHARWPVRGAEGAGNIEARRVRARGLAAGREAMRLPVWLPSTTRECTMRRHPFVLLATCVMAFPGMADGQGTSADRSAVDAALGRAGTPQPGGVMKYSFPRGDLRVTVAGVQLRPALALGSWVAFKRVAGGSAMVMGDLVLAEEEVTPVLRALQAGGVQQTALHNHVLHETPRVMYLHIRAHGDAAKIAATLRSALGMTGTPMTAPPAATAAALELDTAGVARALGVAGKVNGGVYQVSVARQEAVREGREVIPPSMGVATAINFQPTGGGRAAITGDFVMRASEVNDVIRALQSGGIEVSALHSHMLAEEPRLFFMHFWANDDAVKLAATLHQALAETGSKLDGR